MHTAFVLPNFASSAAGCLISSYVVSGYQAASLSVVTDSLGNNVVEPTDKSIEETYLFTVVVTADGGANLNSTVFTLKVECTDVSFTYATSFYAT